jgi:hypothetical protein
MPGAGRGVFVAGPEPVESGTALCLYPGVHTPPLPLSALRAATESGAMLLVLDPATSSNTNTAAGAAGPSAHNAYIMNLPHAGGFIDGDALDDALVEACPTALGHLVNHPPRGGPASNVHCVDFLWRDCFTWRHGELLIDEGDGDEGCWHPIPNELRSNDPWYADTSTHEIVHFPPRASGGPFPRIWGGFFEEEHATRATVRLLFIYLFNLLSYFN